MSYSSCISVSGSRGSWAGGLYLSFHRSLLKVPLRDIHYCVVIPSLCPNVPSHTGKHLSEASSPGARLNSDCRGISLWFLFKEPCFVLVFNQSLVLSFCTQTMWAICERKEDWLGNLVLCFVAHSGLYFKQLRSRVNEQRTTNDDKFLTFLKSNLCCSKMYMNFSLHLSEA